MSNEITINKKELININEWNSIIFLATFPKNIRHHFIFLIMSFQ